MITARAGHTTTRLPDGRVLVAGGESDLGVLRTAEIYDPATGTWSLAGRMGEAKEGGTATRLRDGRILVAGGFKGSYLASAELFGRA